MNFFNKITKNHTFFISEIGINHNGDIQNALKLIQASKLAGCDAVKFQKRTPEIATPKSSWDIVRDTPWGKMKYIDYKKKIEFGKKDLRKDQVMLLNGINKKLRQFNWKPKISLDQGLKLTISIFKKKLI